MEPIYKLKHKKCLRKAGERLKRSLTIINNASLLNADTLPTDNRNLDNACTSTDLLAIRPCSNVASDTSSSNSVTLNFANDQSNFDLIEDEHELVTESTILTEDTNICSHNRCISTISSSGQEINDEITFTTRLTQWAISERVTLSSLGKLLVVMRTHPALKCFLPKDPRTLLQTPRTLCMKPMSSGLFYYLGIADSLNALVAKHAIKVQTDQTVDLSVNIDGLPISKSTNSTFWPILCSLKSLPALKGKVFLVALFHGDHKPDPEEFLSDFVNECTHLSSNGIVINSILCKFRVSMLICDTPAKSLVLATKGHSGYYSCPKCTLAGDLYRNVLCFVETEFIKRTDISFRNKEQPEHHIGTSSLLKIQNFNMIDNVPIDYMHALLLGACKRFLCHKRYGWIFGKPPYKLRAQHVHNLSKQLLMLRKSIPCEFSRKTRSIVECKRYKATEFRLFLLYTGPVVLRKILSKAMYHNFLTLSVASTILISPRYATSDTYVSYAEDLIKCFIKNSINLYGPDFISHSIHCLLHLCDCVRLFGPLDNISAFEFENFLQILKRLIRKHNQPLQQVVRRIYEEQNIFDPSNCIIKDDSFELLMEHYEGPLIDGCKSPQYKKLKTRDYCINVTKKADRFVELKDGTITEIKNIACYKKTSVILGSVFKKVGEFYKKPCLSTRVDIKVIIKRDDELQMWNIDTIAKKLVVLPFKNQFISFPLLHN